MKAGMKATLKGKVKELIRSSWFNYFGKSNHDPYRFGPFNRRPIKAGLIHFVKKNLGSYPDFENFKPIEMVFDKFGYGLQFLYDRLEEKSDKDLLVRLIAYRIVGPAKIKLPLNTPNYWKLFETVNKAMKYDEYLIPEGFRSWLYWIDLGKFNYEVKAYLTNEMVVTEFLVEQYAYRNKGFSIKAESGDVVLDIGACWGDTALYFGHNVGANGNVYSFEFIPSNIEIFKKNLALNVKMENRVIIVDRPISDFSKRKVFFKDAGTSSKIFNSEFEGYSGVCETLTVDDFVEKNNLNKVDFIKMDIEGEEQKALIGAIETIKNFKPKLAICLYHSWEDFSEIPKWIDSLSLGYKFYLKHSRVYSEETVLFAVSTRTV